MDGPRAYADGTDPALGDDSGDLGTYGLTCGSRRKAGGQKARSEEEGREEEGRPEEEDCQEGREEGGEEEDRQEACKEGRREEEKGDQEIREEVRQEGGEKGGQEGQQEEEGSVTLLGDGLRPALHRALRISGALAVLGLNGTTLLSAQSGEPDAAEVYRQLAPRVVKIQSVEQSSGAKSAIGSGFFVSPEGHVVTNYHVISELVNLPDRYRVELIDGGDTSRAVTVQAIDVVHDLAVLKVASAGDPWFDLAAVSVDRGTRLYSMGHPHDLGLSIVEGTYNGLLEHTLYPKIHFTGSINPGMSGGPAVTAAGQVVGVNVSTAGEGISFLVPVERVIALVAEARQPGYRPPDSLLKTVGEQMLAYQDVYLARLFADSTPTIALGGYRVPTKPAAFFKCWGDASHGTARPYETIAHQCSTDDYIFISGDQWSGVLEFKHAVLSTHELNRIRFYSLLTREFTGEGLGDQSREFVTPQRCVVDNVHQGTLLLKTVFCTRRYRRLPGLYDAFFKAVTLGAPNRGLITTLTLSGVTFDNARRVVERYLASLAEGSP